MFEGDGKNETCEHVINYVDWSGKIMKNVQYQNSANNNFKIQYGIALKAVILK